MPVSGQDTPSTNLPIRRICGITLPDALALKMEFLINLVLQLLKAQGAFLRLPL
jgi:hypothetical protein